MSDLQPNKCRTSTEQGGEQVIDKPDHVVLETMMRYGGSFAKSLAYAARFADQENLNRIKSTWPELWAKYSAMAQEESK